MLGHYHPGLGNEATGHVAHWLHKGCESGNGCGVTPFHAKVSKICLTSNSLSTTGDGKSHPRWNAATLREC